MNMAGSIMGNMLSPNTYAPGPGSQLGGAPNLGQLNNFGMGEAPSNENLIRLQEQCARGDGSACIALQSAQMRYGNQMNAYNQQMMQRQYQNQMGAGSPMRRMGARSWG
jgi:hypothetical protein